MSKQRRYQCPECGKWRSKEKGCICNCCTEKLLQNTNREMFGDDVAELMNLGILPDDIGAK